MKLIFVYNAESGIVASLTDAVHKAVSPGTYSCNLCRITYGSVAMKDDWKKFIASLPHAVEFLHRDEFATQYPNLKDSPLPAVFAEDGLTVRILVPASEINKAQDIAGLEEIVKGALSHEQSDAEAYRCPECGLKYRDKETAARCEAWCKEHKSCNLDIIKDAIKE